MFAITTFGIGRPVTARSIRTGWTLVGDEAFIVDFWEPGMVLAEDGTSLRYLLPGEINELGEAKARKLVEVNIAFETATASLTLGCPPSEKDSWPKQTDEAMAWYADNSVSTPYLDALAGYRGIDPLDYRQRTVNKVLQYEAASAFLIGTRQRYADQIDAAEHAVDLDVIEPDFTLPA